MATAKKEKRELTHFISEIKDVEIRGVEVQTFTPEGSDKTHESLLVKFDQIIDRDTDHETVLTALKLKDEDMSHQGDYKRGRMGTLYIKTIIDYKVKESKLGFSYAAETSQTWIEHFEPEDEA